MENENIITAKVDAKLKAEDSIGQRKIHRGNPQTQRLFLFNQRKKYIFSLSPSCLGVTRVTQTTVEFMIADSNVSVTLTGIKTCVLVMRNCCF